MGFDRERSIIAQNAGTTAAALVGHLIAGGGINADDEDAVVESFQAYRDVVFKGTISYAQGEVAAAAAPAPATVEAAEAAVNDSFGQTTEAAAFTIQGAAHGEVPSWVAKEFSYQQSKGKIAPDDTKLFDNRDRLPQFGGSGNAKAPWFRTTVGKVGIWPPKGAS